MGLSNRIAVFGENPFQERFPAAESSSSPFEPAWNSSDADNQSRWLVGLVKAALRRYCSGEMRSRL